MATASAPQGADRSGFPFGLTIAALVAMAVLVGLGVWQIKRLHWKEQLLAEIAAATTSPPEPLAEALAQGSDGLRTEFRRVQADCPDIETTAFIKLYALKDGAIGERIITACRIPGGRYGSILVDRGFIGQDDAARLQPDQGRRLDQPVVGLLRRGDARNLFTPPNQPGQDLWYSRDIAAMAAMLHAPNPAPTFLMLQSPAPQGLGPVPAATPKDIPNNHLQYAITWFGLAAALAGVYLALLWRRRAR
jgi:surfeit locus 1 family protein